jgi:hypothetical protein
MAGKEQEMVREPPLRPAARRTDCPCSSGRRYVATLAQIIRVNLDAKMAGFHRPKRRRSDLFPRLNYSLESGDPEFPTQELAILDSRFRENDEGILAGFSRSFQKAPIAQRK